MMTYRLALIFAAAALTACDTDSPVAEHANEAAPRPEVALANETQAAEIRDNARTPSGASDAPIPPALHGRWGLTPADCESPPGQAKGLLVVRADELVFHEEQAEPVSNVERSANSISGDFVFSGEAQMERRFQALQLQEGQLVRTGNGPAASFTYVRCGRPPA